MYIQLYSNDLSNNFPVKTLSPINADTCNDHHHCLAKAWHNSWNYAIIIQWIFAKWIPSHWWRWETSCPFNPRDQEPGFMFSSHSARKWDLGNLGELEVFYYYLVSSVMLAKSHYLSFSIHYFQTWWLTLQKALPFSSKQRKLKPGSLTSLSEHKIQTVVKGFEKV